MSIARIALANLRYPATPRESVRLAEEAIARAAVERADVLCFPECFVPGYRAPGRSVPPPDPVFLDDAWAMVAAAAKDANVAVVLGTERVVDRAFLISALVVNRDGTIAGFQDKVQLDPAEQSLFSAGSGRRVFQAGAMTFGVAICHEGWRYPETVRWAVRHGAHVVFHPHFHEAEPGSYRPVGFADPANTFHEKAALCRAAENTCFSPPSTSPAQDRRRPRQSCARTGRSWPSSRTVTKVYSWPISTWPRRPAGSPPGTSPVKGLLVIRPSYQQMARRHIISCITRYTTLPYI
jgi:predicted amidohydrolase